MHTLEIIILITASIACFVSIWFIPKQKAAVASFIFLITQFFTWILGLVAVEFGLLEYPVRELSKANSTSFLFEFLALPFICIFFILKYPFNSPIRLKFVYYLAFTSVFTLIEVILEKYTMVIKYHSWAGSHTGISKMLFNLLKIM